MNANNKKITFGYLKNLNKDVKSKDIWKREKAFSILKAMNLEDQNPGLIMYCNYLQGKYHYLNFKQNDSLQSITNAVICYRKVFQIARQYRVCVRNPKYHFKYAESVYKLSQRVFCLFEQNELQNKAYLIAIHSGNKFIGNPSLEWLKRHILGS